MIEIGEVRFYRLLGAPLETALPRLLEKLHERGLKALVRLPDAQSLEAMDRALWTFDPASFLPHGTTDGPEPERQPICLTTGDRCPNGADALVLVNGVAAPEPLGAFRLCLYMFDGNDEAALARARTDWLVYKARAGRVGYWAQREDGGWAQKA
ncbi:MAG: DNA polymerase III subunit chi [Rhodothalassiaceae bacterium]